MTVHEIQIPFPIVGGDVVLSGADVVADIAGDRMIQRWHLSGFQPLLPQQTIHSRGFDRRQKLALWVGPGVEFGARYIGWPRRDQRKTG